MKLLRNHIDLILVGLESQKFALKEFRMVILLELWGNVEVVTSCYHFIIMFLSQRVLESNSLFISFLLKVLTQSYCLHLDYFRQGLNQIKFKGIIKLLYHSRLEESRVIFH